MPLSSSLLQHLAQSHDGITADSRQVKKNWLFVALPHAHAGPAPTIAIGQEQQPTVSSPPPAKTNNKDGYDFATAALANGASAILTDRPLANLPAHIPVIISDNPRHDLARLAAAMAGDLPNKVVAVTGTNGKSSIVQLARALWATHDEAGDSGSASIGTLGIITQQAGHSTNLATSHTTPDPSWLYQQLHLLKTKGINRVAIEASSHGLHQSRLDGLAGHLAAAAMAELGQDHLDYHQTLTHYYNSKLRLFTDLLTSHPPSWAIWWAHNPVSQSLHAITKDRGLRPLLLSFNQKHTTSKPPALRVLSLTPLANLRQKITFLLWGKQYDAELSLSGQFQAENTLTALMLVLASNPNSWENPLAVEPYLPQLAGLDAIRGRLEKIDNSNHPAHFFVDYAHTETALATTLAALRPLTRGRLIVVFGCGGNRDPFKRAKMGKVAAEMADVAIITDDNPRHEDPRTIRAAILSACPKGIEATSRQEAIGTAVAMAEMGDIVLVAGKGHETGQIVGDNILPFDDAVVIKNMIDNHAQR